MLLNLVLIRFNIVATVKAQKISCKCWLGQMSDGFVISTLYACGVCDLHSVDSWHVGSVALLALMYNNFLKDFTDEKERWETQIKLKVHSKSTSWLTNMWKLVFFFIHFNEPFKQ